MKNLLLFLLLMLCLPMSNYGQRKSKNVPTSAYDSTLYGSLKWRNIGPFRGGRSAAVTGVSGKPGLYYFGATGGGVWRSSDAGASWENISDAYFGGSIGAIAVSPSNNNIIYVGGGEKTVRGNVSHGDGIWKSLDAGKTWEFMGLADSRHICRIRVHPENPDIVYAAVLGHLFGSNQMRGVYRSKDGGKNWERILFANADAGAVDLVFNPQNPRELYASTWRVRRTPYSLESGGEGSALWKSSDGGDTWQNLSEAKDNGLPKAPLGIIGVTVSPVNPERVWAIIEAKQGGVFRSDNGGKTWRKINSERKLRQRAWYYTRIYADPQNADIVYVLNVRFHRSKDGGKSFESISTPHGDHHDLWIAPEDPQRMIIGDDGGAQVSLNGGESWSTYHNQATAQFYRVVTDNHFPYRIYGGQQDNSTVRISSRSYDNGISEAHWESTAGGESAHLAPHPANPDIVFGGSYGGFLTRYDHQKQEVRAVDVYPDNHMGWAAKDVRYRFQWNFPIFFSPHAPHPLYAAANVLFRSNNEGQSWEKISPDLTRNDTTKMGSSGGLITKDNTSVEYYGTIFAAFVSPHDPQMIWTGSDDGLVHLSRDNGNTWENITPKNFPEWLMINSLEPHPSQKGTCYLAGTRYKLDDFAPYLYKTTDYGKTWTKITQGIAPDHFTRALRCDPTREGLLYAGTERGVYVSFDDGANWQSLQNNLPIVPITDLAVRENDLIAATQGRSFWILDHLEVLQQLKPELKSQDMYLFQPDITYNRMGGEGNPKSTGQNPPPGVGIHFYLKELPDSSQNLKLDILDNQGQIIQRFATKRSPEEKQENLIKDLKVQKGLNRFGWNTRYPDALDFDGLILWFGGLRGPLAPPGSYKVRLSWGEKNLERSFEIRKDPNLQASQADLEAQFKFLLQIRDKLSETHRAIKQIREARQQITQFTKHQSDSLIKHSADNLLKALGEVEKTLYQTKNQSPQDPLNFPVKLNNRLSALATMASIGFNRPTAQMYEVQKDISGQIDQELSKLRRLLSEDLKALNQLILERKVPIINLDKP